MKLEPVIGLEIHVQLKTKSKMFCGCDNDAEGAAPNTHICPVCTGHPGTLPVVNAKAVEFGIMAAKALGCRILDRSKFDRKNYFYPDLPKGYQISQFDEPVGLEGELTVEVPEAGERERSAARIGITRLHLEEDAAKLTHGASGASLVDFNRAGTPLAEIVTEPDFASPAEAKAFLYELRLMMRMLGVSDADMEKGHLRCDANISMREVLDDAVTEKGSPRRLNAKTEVKNLNSFRSVERALEYEIMRQSKLWEAGDPPTVTTTRGWDDDRQISVEQRSKEESADYRYFPEPDLPPLRLTELAADVETRMPELPAAKRARFMDEYALTAADARQIVNDPALADYVEQVMSELREWVSASDEGVDWDVERPKFAKLMSGWLLSKLMGLMAEDSTGIRDTKITAENFAEFLTLLYLEKINSTAGQAILREMHARNAVPTQVMREQGLEQMSSLEDLEDICEDVIAANPKVVGDYTGGKKEAVMYLVGQVMKATKGRAKPDLVREILETKLK